MHRITYGIVESKSADNTDRKGKEQDHGEPFGREITEDAVVSDAKDLNSPGNHMALRVHQFGATKQPRAF